MDGLVHDQIRDLDALVVGAGFGGIYMLHKLRHELGLDAVHRRRINRFHHKPTGRCASSMAQL
jgi:NADH dehydrogenase FAD-containing subunit